MAEAGLKGSKDSETDPETEEINRMLDLDIPSEEPATDTPAEDAAPPEPPKRQNSRNKPGMSMKTRDESRSRGVEKSRSQEVESRQPELAQALTSATDGC
jgi:hypothetical protein